jgi:hypothetical protein
VSITVNNPPVIGSDVFDPAYPDVIYTSSNQPAPPAFNNTNVVKWGHTARLAGDHTHRATDRIYTREWYSELSFQKLTNTKLLMGKKYPLFIFFHGRGEAVDNL